MVDFTALQAAISGTQQVISSAKPIADEMIAAAQRSGPTPWGDDPALGQAFGSVFADPRAVLLEAIQGMPDMFQKLADSLGTTTSSFHQAQQEAILTIARSTGAPSETV